MYVAKYPVGCHLTIAEEEMKSLNKWFQYSIQVCFIFWGMFSSAATFRFSKSHPLQYVKRGLFANSFHCGILFLFCVKRQVGGNWLSYCCHTNKTNIYILAPTAWPIRKWSVLMRIQMTHSGQCHVLDLSQEQWWVSFTLSCCWFTGLLVTYQTIL